MTSRPRSPAKCLPMRLCLGLEVSCRFICIADCQLERTSFGLTPRALDSLANLNCMAITPFSCPSSCSMTATMYSQP